MAGRGTTGHAVDIRPMQECVEWSIPGSMHINAYDALKANDPKSLTNVEFPSDIAVVTVCAAGKTSLVAAQIDEAVGVVIHAPREVFIEHVMMRLPPTPPNYRQVVTFNEMGLLPESGVTALEAGANRCAVSRRHITSFVIYTIVSKESFL